MKKHVLATRRQLLTLLLGCALVVLVAPTLVNCTDPASPAKFTVTFSMNGGSPPVEDIIVEVNKRLTKPSPNPNKEGYAFVGWYKDIALTTLFDFTSEVITRDVTLYAKWAITTHTVNFNSNGGTDVDQQMVESGKKASRPTDPTKAGYTFENWYSDEILATLFDFNANAITANITLYAKWDVATSTYTVTFNYNDGGTETDLQQQVNQGQNVEKPTSDPTKEGYVFENWYSDEALTTLFDFDANTITADITLYAKWDVATSTYTVTFNYNDGGTETDLQQQVNQGQNVEKPTSDPTKEGYVFEDWYSDEALGTLFDFDANTITADITLYAKWDVATYTVTFNYNDGGTETDLQQQANHGQNVEKPTPDPTRIGYTLENWYSDEALGTLFDFDANTITADITLYAKWDATAYHTVTFNYNDGGTETDLQQQVNQGQNVEKPNPVRTGYTLENWYSDESLTTLFDFNANIITQDITLYAKWDATAYYTVTFNYNDGGTETDLQQQVNQGQNVEKPTPDPTRIGYTLENWYSDESLATLFDFDANTITADIILYAKWDVATYTVHFNSNGGTRIDSDTIEYGKTVSRPADPTKEGYTFEGWYNSEVSLTTAFDFNANTITTDITLYAKWGVATYTVSFNSNGGTDVEQQTVENKKTTSRPTNPTKANHAFKGWYSDVALTTLFDFDTETITRDTTLYAKWVRLYTVTFDSRGGSAVESATVEHGQTVSGPTNPTREGYRFIVWSQDFFLGTAFRFTETKITGDITLYADWRRVNTVTFNSNGGTEVEQQTVSVGGKPVKPLRDPTKEGYAFKGWYKDVALTIPFGFFVEEITEDITLYAKWAKLYTVTYDTNGGSAVENDTVASGDLITNFPSTPSRTAYAFLGWHKDAALTIRFDFDTEVVTGDITIYVRWRKKYTVTFDSNGGSTVENDTITSGARAVRPADPSKEGYGLLGWCKDAALTMLFDFGSDTVTEDITLYAKWAELNIPDVRFRAKLKTLIPNAFTGEILNTNSTHVTTMTSLNVSDLSIQSLKGVEYFTALTSLDCPNNNLSTLDVSSNTKLTSLNCSNNNLSALDVSTNLLLQILYCSENSLNRLDVDGNIDLTKLECSGDSLSTLDVSSNTKLTDLNCSDNNLSTLDVSSNTTLTGLNCSNNNLSTLDVSNNTKLTSLNCSRDSLSTLSVSSNTLLTSLDCSDNNLTTLGVGWNTELRSLYCNNNELTTLDVTSSPNLNALHCHSNELIRLDMKTVKIARYLSIFADEDDEKTNVIEVLQIHGEIKDESQIKSAKTYRGDSMKIYTYSEDPNSGDYVLDCGDYDPNADDGNGACKDTS